MTVCRLSTSTMTTSLCLVRNKSTISIILFIKTRSTKIVPGPRPSSSKKNMKRSNIFGRLAYIENSGFFSQMSPKHAERRLRRGELRPGRSRGALPGAFWGSPPRPPRRRWRLRKPSPSFHLKWKEHVQTTWFDLLGYDH